MSIVDIASYQDIVVLTGAGVSVASGMPTYRGDSGLWKSEPLASLASAKALRERPQDVWQFSMGLRMQAQNAAPNAAHKALAELERKAAGQFTLITQNVDGLHQRAGSSNVLELHGSIHRSRCSRCEKTSFEDGSAPNTAPACSHCEAPQRVDVVLFDENLPAGAEHQAKRALRECDLFIAIGTSGNVFPAANFVRSARYVGARTMLINLDAEKQDSNFEEVYRERAEEFLPTLVSVG